VNNRGHMGCRTCTRKQRREFDQRRFEGNAMSLRDRIEANHPAVLEGEAAIAEANAAKVAAKRARQADDSGTNTAVPPDKSSC
jgi:hypothetical protein